MSDIDKALEEAIDEVVVSISEDTVDNEVTAADDKKGGNGTALRNVFPKINKITMVKGKRVKTHPFLEGNSESELVFLRLLNAEKPFLAPHGMGTTVWSDFIDLVNRAVDSNNQPLFGEAPLTTRYAKDRLTDYFNFVKNNISTTPFRSGTDDEEPPNEVTQLIEDLYEQKTSFQVVTNEKKAAERNAIEKNKNDSDALWAASLKGYVPRPPPGQDDATFILNLESNVDTPLVAVPAVSADRDETTTTVKKSGDMRVDGPSMDSFVSLDEQYRRRLDLQAQKQRNRKAKLDLMLKREEEKQKEREERRKQREYERDQDRMDSERTELLMQTLLELSKQNKSETK
jgi:hypothetical protein